MLKQPLERYSAVSTKVSFKNQRHLYKSVMYLKHSRISTMELSSDFQSSTIFTKNSIVDLRRGSKYASASILILINNE